MTSTNLRKAFLDFWTEEPRNAKIIPNMSLVPNIDSTLLFVNSGMFPLSPYLAGQPHPSGTRLVNIQRCLRTNYDEMLEVGDNRHTLMFEMMGNWSLGDFTKEQQIPWILEFWVERCGIDPKRLYISVFAGDDDAPRDDEAIKIWQKAFKKYDVDAEFSKDITQIPQNLEEGQNWRYRIFPYEKKKNWWERAHAIGELGGPTSEMFYDMGFKERDDAKYHINDDSGRFIEIGNNVFMEYKLDAELKWQPLEQKNIDFGGGFERVAMISQNKKDIFETDIYESILKRIEEISKKEYKTQSAEGAVENEDTKYFRILADHSRAATFILADGVYPSNKDQGYILRRFIRRLVRYGLKLGIDTNFTKDLAIAVIGKLSEVYPHLKESETMIIDEIEKEEIKFRRTLDTGLREFKKYLYAEPKGDDAGILYTNENRLDDLTGKDFFFLYETYGFPFEMSLDELNIDDDKIISRLREEYKAEEQKHREASRAGAEQKFKGGLADQSRETTKLHTAHHLLLAALQQLVDPSIKQRGSNITAERLRIDFNFDRKLTEEELKKVEDLVNEKIEQGLEVIRKELPKNDAERIGAEMEFGQKYPDLVSVYFIAPSEESLVPYLSTNIKGDVFSAEFCGGPHVENTKELAEGGKKFKILKEESSGAGIRRIKAALV